MDQTLHKELNDIYYDLPNTFLLYEFCLQESFISPNMTSQEVEG